MLAVVVGVCLRWRTDQPRRATLGAMTVVVLGAGLYNGSSVPAGLEQARLSFYHWAFVLAFFVALVIGLALAGPIVRAGRAAVAGRPPTVAALAALTVLAVAAPSVVNPHLDRTTNEPAFAGAYLDPDVVDRLTDAALSQGDAAEQPSAGPRPQLAALRDVRRHPVVRPRRARRRRALPAHRPVLRAQRAGSSTLTRSAPGWCFVVDDGLASPTPPGRLIGRADLGSGLAVDDYRALVAAAEAADGEVVLGDELAASLTADERVLATASLDGLVDDPEAWLLRPEVLEFLAENPPLTSPALDPDQAARVLASIEGRTTPWRPGTATGIRVFLLDREDILATATPGEIGPLGRG